MDLHGSPGWVYHDDVVLIERLAWITGGFDHVGISRILVGYGLGAGHGDASRDPGAEHERHHDLSSNQGRARRHAGHRHARSSSPFDQLPSKDETDRGTGMTLPSLWRTATTRHQSADGLAGGQVVRRLVEQGQTRFRYGAGDELLSLPAARVQRSLWRRLRHDHRRPGPLH